MVDSLQGPTPPHRDLSGANGLARAQSETMPASRAPGLQRFSSERPQPQTRPSRLGTKLRSKSNEKKEKRKKTPQLERQATLTFDSFSSESSSSSDEDEPLKPSHVDRQAHDEPKATRGQRSGQGPFSRFKIDHEQFHTKGRVSKHDGRLKLSINETLNSGWFAKTLGAGLRKHLEGTEAGEHPRTQDIEPDQEKIPPEEDIMEDAARRVKLNIVVIVIGSRGDIQPFLRIGKILKEDYGHRVRIATHPAFKKFVQEDSGLEFFSVGGNPSELMAFMVKNPGLIPNFETIKEGEVGKRRAAMYEMFLGMWRACINSTDDEGDKANLKMSKHNGRKLQECIPLIIGSGEQKSIHRRRHHCKPAQLRPSPYSRALGYSVTYDVHVRTIRNLIVIASWNPNTNTMVQLSLYTNCTVSAPFGKH